ncbi:PQQ-dependent sugar dehydrogenase [Pseudoxanthomonas sp.]|uniref:PQQ-dependent sugar dehydrogenase n=1 Tax=Pseudoxanthomonas sp. TaxID=1871049 RepID=UPI00260171C7|nr:PQQ-dependent sugar dehydrogenase [Pseudoxanthomonas sp.]WDS35549.1 MAG: PQQ-dependent sugar dehydrogenase [Pseudoxanthomonas sp.]
MHPSVHGLRVLLLPALLAMAACGGAKAPAVAGVEAADGTALPFTVTPVHAFKEPWAMAFLPDGRLLVTEKAGHLQLFDLKTGTATEIHGVPQVDYGGQGGFGDVVLHPDFANNRVLYLSYAEAGQGDTRGAAVARATLALDAAGGGTLQDLKVIWRQVPKVEGRGHYGHRMAFDRTGKLWISSSERQKFDPAQDMASNLGKIVRLNDDGSVPADNPFASQGGVAAQVWSLGHRNVLGLAFDAQGRLWAQEMGPKGGDELNLVERGANYGYPIVSNGDHYDGRDIPDHPTRPEFAAPKITWNPVISPAGLLIYSGSQFPDWKGNAFIGGLSSHSLVRITFDGGNAHEAARYDMGQRIREVEQGPDGALWLLEDGEDGSDGRLLKLTPAA